VDRRSANTLGRCLLAALAAFVLAMAAPAIALTPTADINSAGPLTDIWIGNELSCQISAAGDSNFDFCPPDSMRGTAFSVENTCAATLTKVTRGSVLVDYFRRHKTIVVKAGQSFLAKASGARSTVVSLGKK
jgi:hypothetical protein